MGCAIRGLFQLRAAISGCYDTRLFLEMAVDGNSSSISDIQGRSRDTCIGAHARQWRLLNWSFSGVFLKMLGFDMPFVRHATGREYVRRMRELLRADIFSDSDMDHLY